MITIHPNMSEKYQDTYFGVLALKNFEVRNRKNEEFLKFAQKELDYVREIYTNYNRKQKAETHDVLRPYVDYYKKFKKTYHVLLQLESVINGKNLPNATPLVQAMFLTEIKTALLIAGHDLKKCKTPLVLHMSRGGESYFGSGDREIIVKPNDICLSDQDNLILSIIYGQDEKTRITEDTRDVLFLIDGVPGLGKKHVEEGLEILMSFLTVLDPEIIPVEMSVISFGKDQ